MVIAHKNGRKSRRQPKQLKLKKSVVTTPRLSLFDNLPELITPIQVTQVLPFTRNTVYDWHYRPDKYEVPADLFVKKRNPRAKTLIRRDVLKAWKCA